MKTVINTNFAYWTLCCSILYIIKVGIGAYFVYYKHVNSNKENVSTCDYVYQTEKN